MRGIRTRGRVLGIACVLMLAVALSGVGPVLAEPSAEAADTGDVVAKLIYRKGDGSSAPLAGVAVLVFEPNAGFVQVRCTNSLGLARIPNAPAGADLTVYVQDEQPNPTCSNVGFYNPDTGQKLLADVRDGVQVAADGTTRVRFMVRTPRAQNLVCGGYFATWVGTQGADVYNGTPGRDVIVGLGGDDQLGGGDDIDYICGGRGKDTLRGGDGQYDWLFGEEGMDTLYGQGGTDYLFGGLRSDLLAGAGGDDYLFGEDGNDTVNGGIGTDFCSGETKIGCEN